MNGKGSKPRPMSIDRDEWAERWERITWSQASTETMRILCNPDNPDQCCSVPVCPFADEHINKHTQEE
jgi:hypothetical protein